MRCRQRLTGSREMLTLPEFQRRFKEHVFGAPSPELLALVVDNHVAADAQLQLYRNNTFVSLRAALKAAYPGLCATVGEAYFFQLARQYLLAHPSESGDIQQYGCHLPAFIAALESAAAYPYLTDLARLEWACQQVYHAADGGRFEATKLAGVDQAGYQQLVFRLNPALRLVKSAYPIVDIWQLATGVEVEKSVVMENNPHWALAVRSSLEVDVQAVSEADYALLAKIHRRAPLADCLEAALQYDAGFDLHAALLQYIRLGAIVDVD